MIDVILQVEESEVTREASKLTSLIAGKSAEMLSIDAKPEQRDAVERSVFERLWGTGSELEEISRWQEEAAASVTQMLEEAGYGAEVTGRWIWQIKNGSQWSESLRSAVETEIKGYMIAETAGRWLGAAGEKERSTGLRQEAFARLTRAAGLLRARRAPGMARTSAGMQEILDRLKEIENFLDELKGREETDVAELLSELLKGMIGSEEGIAPLDEQGLIDERYIPIRYKDYLEFDGIIGADITPQFEKTSAGTDYGVYYSEKLTRFIAARQEGEPGTLGSRTYYYNIWPNSSIWGPGTDSGISPQIGRIYCDKSTGKLYRAEGLRLGAVMLVEIPAGGGVIGDIDHTDIEEAIKKIGEKLQKLEGKETGDNTIDVLSSLNHGTPEYKSAEDLHDNVPLNLIYQIPDTKTWRTVKLTQLTVMVGDLYEYVLAKHGNPLLHEGDREEMVKEIKEEMDGEYVKGITEVSTQTNFKPNKEGYVAMDFMAPLKADPHPNGTLMVTLDEEKLNAKIEAPTGGSGRLEAQAGVYYRIDAEVGTLSVILPQMEQTERTAGVILCFRTGGSPAVTIEGGGAEVAYFEGYAIEANTAYELNVMWNGVRWVVAHGVIE